MELQRKFVKTKKDHRCFGCQGVIPSGRTVSKWAGICEGDFIHGYTCEICESVVEKMEYGDFPYYEGDLKEREEWEIAAQEFEERTGTSHNNAVMPFVQNHNAVLTNSITA
jgi:hypothetical protein